MVQSGSVWIEAVQVREALCWDTEWVAGPFCPRDRRGFRSRMFSVQQRNSKKMLPSESLCGGALHAPLQRYRSVSFHLFPLGLKSCFGFQKTLSYFSVCWCNQHEFSCIRPAGHPGHHLPRQGGRVFAAGRDQVVLHRPPAVGAELPEPRVSVGLVGLRGPSGGRRWPRPGMRAEWFRTSGNQLASVELRRRVSE